MKKNVDRSITIIQEECASAQENMDRDARFLDQVHPDDPPLLHIYSWRSPSVTYGHFVKPQEFLNLDILGEKGIEIGRRPTGGGIIFHTWDLAFGLIVPKNFYGYHDKPLDNYHYVNEIVRNVVKDYLNDHAFQLLPTDPVHPSESVSRFCMAKPTIYDVMLNGLKIAGAAQRKKPNGYLHQGTISIASPDFELLEAVVKDREVVRLMKENSYCMLPSGWSPNELAMHRKGLGERLKQAFIADYCQSWHAVSRS